VSDVAGTFGVGAAEVEPRGWGSLREVRVELD